MTEFNLGQTTMPDGRPASVIIVGAGIIGTCCALDLLRCGFQVTIVDQTGPAAGASAGNAGAISPGSCIPLATPGILKEVPSWLLARDGPLVIRRNYFLRSLPWFMRFIWASNPDRFMEICRGLHALHSNTHANYAPLLEYADAGQFIRQTGAITAYESEAEFQSSMKWWYLRSDLGIKYRVLKALEIHDLAPALSQSICHGVLQEDHGYVNNPKKFVSHLFKAACERGAKYTSGKVQKIAIEANKGIAILENNETLHADFIVVATGAASSTLIKSLPLSVPLERQRGYHLHLKNPGIELSIPVSFAKSKFYATPMENDIRLAGTVEFASTDTAPDYARADALGKMACKALPGLQTNIASRWMGNRPCLPDTLPVIDRLAKFPNIILAFGHGHNGMTSASTTAQIVTDLITQRRSSLDVSPYRSTRFS